MESVEMRYSFGFFSFQENMISTPEEMVDKDHPLAYKPFHHDGLLAFYETVEVHLKAHRTMTKAYCGIQQAHEPNHNHTQTWLFQPKCISMSALLYLLKLSVIFNLFGLFGLEIKMSMI